MTSSAPAKYAHYLADFQSLVQGPGADAPTWLKNFRDEAWTKFSETGLPIARRGNERWKYTNVRPIDKIDFAAAARPQSANGSGALVPDYKIDGPAVFDLVFVDGYYSAELSSPSTGSNGITAASLASVTGDSNVSLEGQIGHYASSDDDGFTALNSAFLYDGAYIHVADGNSDKVVVRLSYITSNSADNKVTFPRTLIVAGRNRKSVV